MSQITSKIESLENAVADFVARFEIVFHHDWSMTIDCIQYDNSSLFIDREGTFLKPDVGEDESNNWNNRGALLKSYRNLKQILNNEGIKSNICDADEYWEEEYEKYKRESEAPQLNDSELLKLFPFQQKWK